MVKKKTEIEKVPKCRICSHPDREGIELLSLLSCSSWNICRERVNNTFGTNFTIKTIKNHLMHHELHKAALEQGIILDSIRGKDGAPGIISAESMMQTLLVQGMLDLAKGNIRCKTPQELISVVNALQNLQTRRDAQYAIESGDPAGFYGVMAAYGEAIRDTVSVSQMQEIIAKANALGANFNIANTSVAEVIDVEPIDYMQQAVDDYKTYGRTRTRDELLDAGVFDTIEQDLDLPE